jgi:hypothetical protein
MGAKLLVLPLFLLGAAVDLIPHLAVTAFQKTGTVLLGTLSLVMATPESDTSWMLP